MSFKVDINLKDTIEGIVSAKAMQELTRRMPIKEFEDTEEHHQEREIMFENIFAEMMYNLTVHLNITGWPCMKVPPDTSTTLTLEVRQ